MDGKVNILLCVYNGSRYLDDQLQSIDSQTLRPHRITIRDDGSSDNSLFQVERWASSRPQVSVLHGPRLGPMQNFFTLLSREDNSSDYFAFCDQDDVWLPDKLERAVKMVRQHAVSEPVMYCSRVEFVGEDLRHLGYSNVPKHLTFANALVENIAVGCTIVLNRQARDLIAKSLPSIPVPHDWWCYLVISALGKVYYDEQPSMKYRQHPGNVTGGTSVLLELLRRRLVRFSRSPASLRFLSDKAEEFNRGFGELLPPDKKRILDRFLMIRGNLWTRLSYNLNMDVMRQTWIDTAILRTLIVIGRA